MMAVHTVSVKREVQVKYLKAKLGVRYWEDASVDGVDEDNDLPRMPHARGDAWTIIIDLDTGKIGNWPAGTTARTHYKVCDDGAYLLLDASGQVVAEKIGYVPSMLSPEDSGFGDYVILTIDGEGEIQGWKPDLSYFEDDEE